MQKIFKSLFVIAGFFVIFNYATLLKAENKEGVKAAFALFKSMEMSKTYKDTLEKIVDMQIQANPNLYPFKKIMAKFFGKYMGWDSVKDELAQLYASNFTVKEMKELRKFYETPVGKKSIKVFPYLYEQGSRIGQKKVQAHMAELQHQIMEKAKAIQEKHEKAVKKSKKK